MRGAVALPNVLEAHRNAREALARYIDDVAAGDDAAAAVRLLHRNRPTMNAGASLVAPHWSSPPAAANARRAPPLTRRLPSKRRAR